MDGLAAGWLLRACHCAMQCQTYRSKENKCRLRIGTDREYHTLFVHDLVGSTHTRQAKEKEMIKRGGWIYVYIYIALANGQMCVPACCANAPTPRPNKHGTGQDRRYGTHRTSQTYIPALLDPATYSVAALLYFTMYLALERTVCSWPMNKTKNKLQTTSSITTIITSSRERQRQQQLVRAHQQTAAERRQHAS